MDTQDYHQEPEDDSSFVVPENLRESRKWNGRVCVAGRGPTDTKLMFITTSVSEEETAEQVAGAHRAFSRKPGILRGPAALALKDMCTTCGIMLDQEVYYTALAKWLLPKGERYNPKLTACEPGRRCLERELREVKPSIVVTLGKAAFEFMTELRIRFDEAQGIWFWSDKWQCRVMPLSHQNNMIVKPEWLERYRLDLKQVKLELDALRGVVVEKVPLEYTTVTCRQQLRQVVDEIKAGGFKVLSPDCEWHGHSHVDGYLRSLQLAWRPGRAVYIRFMDDRLQYAFDCSYEEAGAILSEVWDPDDVELVGHHISADLPWTATKLKLKWKNKTRLDTEFAYQVTDEHGDRGLERMSLRYTDLGRYEAALDDWKRHNKDKAEDGYGFVPDEILIPYACKDVDTVIRSYLPIEDELRRQGQLAYYRNILNPFCTDVFTQFALTGLPMNVREMHQMRHVYGFAYERIYREFLFAMHQHGLDVLAGNVAEALVPIPAEMPDKQRTSILETAAAPIRRKLAHLVHSATPDSDMQPGQVRALSATEVQQALTRIPSVTPAVLERVAKAIDFAVLAGHFNINSADHKKLWLFDALRYTPVKSTSNKARGMPSMSWEKVMRLKPDVRAEMKPAVDKETLRILKDQHGNIMLKRMLTLLAIGTIRKSFLKDPVRDQDGEIEEEAGLLSWVSSDDRIHGQLSLTETTRPRAWNPNILNWPSGVQDQIRDAIVEAVQSADKEGVLPPELRMYLDPKRILSLRSTVQAPTGYCCVESDYVTAEVFGLAFISGDENLIRIMTEPDQQFAVLDDDDGTPVRLDFAPDCGIPPAAQDPKFIMAVWDKGELKKSVTPDMLRHNADGALQHPRVDLHWSLAERFRMKPREILDKKKDRGAGKVGNFCIAKGQPVLTRRGWVPVEQLLDSDKLWDGQNWVSHNGVVCTGVKEVVSYGGLQATGNHYVWLASGRMTMIEQALLDQQDLAIVRPDASSEGVWWPEDFDDGVEVGLPELPADISGPVEVYDVLDTGRQHRFVCAGVLVSNSVAYGATPASIERKLTADMGQKPDEGTGQAILDALDARQPVAQAWLKGLEMAPVNPGYLRAASGKVRHFIQLSEGLGLGFRQQNSYMSAQGREARNFFMQESVAATAGRAATWLMDFGHHFGLQGRPFICLYDSLVTLCPLEERFIWERAHELCMSLANGWSYHDRVLRYNIETEFNAGWGLNPRGIDKLMWKNPAFRGTPEHLQPIVQWLDAANDFYRKNEKASLAFKGWRQPKSV